MGFQDKKTTRLLVSPSEPITPTAPAALHRSAPFLDASEQLLFTMFGAALGSQGEPTRSAWHIGKEKLQESVINQRSTDSTLQVQGYPSSVEIGLGAPAPNCRFSADWVIRAVREDNGVRFTVPRYGMLNDRVPNDDALREIRAACQDALATRPPRIEVVAGPPAPESFLSTEPIAAPAKDKGLLADFLWPAPAEFTDGYSIPLPDADATVLHKAMTQTLCPVSTDLGTGTVVLALDGGRPASGAAILAEERDGGQVLRFRLDRGEGRLNRMRSFRAGIVALDNISAALRSSAPESAARIISAVASLCGDRSAPTWAGDLRNGFRQPEYFHTNYDTAKAVPLGHGSALPVALVVDGLDQSLAPTLRKAAAWLLVRGRVLARGFRAETRFEKSVITARRPAFVRFGDRLMPSIRYVHTGSLPLVPEVAVTEAVELTWFWESTLRSTSSAGRRETVLALTGVSRRTEEMTYGAEYLRLLGTFAHLVKTADPTATFRTVLLHL
ncbi:MAG TPA: hypothetical protein VHX38_21580 [Pseudonocardiaceae bacterium]|jgi:hypothetical protein|nr:hypothetical protein [Pseudonocardiaceae bacterium]